MSAEVLRRAAALMRERAGKATPGPWEWYGDLLVWPSDKGPAANDPILATFGEAHDDCGEHIASWHPAVALAVADWLEATARTVESAASDGFSPATRAALRITEPEALVVARAYLGADQ